MYIAKYYIINMVTYFPILTYFSALMVCQEYLAPPQKLSPGLHNSMQIISFLTEDCRFTGTENYEETHKNIILSPHEFSSLLVMKIEGQFWNHAVLRYMMFPAAMSQILCSGDFSSPYDSSLFTIYAWKIGVHWLCKVLFASKVLQFVSHCLYLVCSPE